MAFYHIKDTQQFNLPCNDPEAMTSPCPALVLDLDETLVHCKIKPLSGFSITTKVIMDGQERTIYIAQRPGLQDFLRKMSTLYNLVLFTTGIKEYAETVLKALQIRRFFNKILSRENCSVTPEGKYVKNLSILGIPMSRVIFIDDWAFHGKNQPLNFLLIKRFEGDIMDKELTFLAKFLKRMAKKMDVRPVGFNFESFKRNHLPKSPDFVSNSTQLEPESTVVDKSRENFESSSSNYQMTESNFEGIDENFEDQNLSKKLQKLSWSQGASLSQTSRKYCDLLRSASPNHEIVCYETVKFQQAYNKNFFQQEKSSDFQNRLLDTVSSVITEGLNEERLVPKLPVVNLKCIFQDKINIIVKRN